MAKHGLSRTKRYVDDIFALYVMPSGKQNIKIRPATGNTKNKLSCMLYHLCFLGSIGKVKRPYMQKAAARVSFPRDGGRENQAAFALKQAKCRLN